MADDLSVISEEDDEPLREALKRVKPVLCQRLPIEFLPTVLESERVIGCIECTLITEERTSVARNLKLLELIEKKSIPVIRQFLEILKSNADFYGYGYLADKVYSESAEIAKKKEATADAIVAVATAKPTPTTKRAVRNPPYTLARKRKSTVGRRKKRAPSPKVVYVPIFTELETKFALLAAATSEVIRKLDHHSFANLLYFLRHLPQVDEEVFPSCSEPLSVQDLLILLEESWNFANFHLADAIAQFFSDFHSNNSLAERVVCYKEALEKDLPVALAECKKKRVRPKRLESRSLLALVSPEEQKGFYLRQILTCRQFLTHNLGIKAALFVGFDEGGSIRVFFSIPRTIVWHLVPMLQAQLSVLCEMRVTHVQIIGQFIVETGSGKVTYWDQDVMGGAGVSALWNRKMKEKMQELECGMKDELKQLEKHLDAALAENAAELDQLRQERMSLQLKLQAANVEKDSLKDRLEAVAQSIALQPISKAVESEHPPPPPPRDHPPPPGEEEVSDPFALLNSTEVQRHAYTAFQETGPRHSQAIEILDCLERLEVITPLETVSLAHPGDYYFTLSDDTLLRVLERKPAEVIDTAIDVLTPFEDKIGILVALKSYSLLFQKELLKMGELKDPPYSYEWNTNNHYSWSERLLYVQLSKSPDVLEATANILVEVAVPLDVISWFKVVATLFKEGLIAKNANIAAYCRISFKSLMFQQLEKSWAVVDRCAGILAQHGKAEYAEALIRLKHCVEIDLFHPARFHGHCTKDPTVVGIIQFVLENVRIDVPTEDLALIELCERFGYNSLASAVTDFLSLAELMREDERVLYDIRVSLNSSVTAEGLHVVYLLSERNLADKYECQTLLSALSRKAFGHGVLVMNTHKVKAPDVMSKFADILEECKSFPTVAKQLRVMVTVVEELHLTTAERCRLKIIDAKDGSEADDACNQWMSSLASVVATRPVEDVMKAATIFEQYNEPFLAARLKVLGSLVLEQLLSKEERQRVVMLAFNATLADKWEAALLQLQERKGKPTLVRTEEILQALPQSVS